MNMRRVTITVILFSGITSIITLFWCLFCFIWIMCVKWTKLKISSFIPLKPNSSNYYTLLYRPPHLPFLISVIRAL